MAVANSARFVQLVERIEELRSILLPNPFDPTGQYPVQQVTKTCGFRILCHAEFEAYVEDRTEDVAKTALRAWKSGGTVCRALLSLVCFSGLTAEGPPESLSPSQPTQLKTWPRKLDIGERVAEATTAYMREVRNNHGIKEENLLRLLLPVGVRPSRLDVALLADCNSFGAARGEVAHGSMVRVNALPDPKSEYETVLRLVTGLGAIDIELSELRADAASSLPEST